MVVSFDPTWVQLLNLVLAFVLPLLVGLVTKLSTSSGTRAILLAALSLVTGVLTEALAAMNAGTDFDLAGSLYAFAGTFIVAVATHFGLWKPTGVSRKAIEIGSPKHERVTAL